MEPTRRRGIQDKAHTSVPSLDLEESEIPVSSKQAEFGLSAWQVGFSVANLILGNAVFTIPYGFVKCGWSSAIFIILSVGVMLYTAALLGDVLNDMEDIENRVHRKELDYAAIGELAVGQAFRPVFAMFCVGECFNMVVFFLVFTGSSLGSTFSCSSTRMIWMGAFLGSFFTLIPDRFMAVVSAAGIFLVLGAVLVVVCSGLALAADGVDQGQSFLGTDGLFGLPGVMGTVGMAVADHPVFPRLYCASRSRESYRKGLGIGYSIFLAVALMLSTAAYATYGTSIKSVVLTNIGQDAHGMKLKNFPAELTVVCNVALSIRCIQVLPAFLNPVIQQIEQIVVHMSDGRSWLPSKLSQSRWNPASRFMLTLVSLFVCAHISVCLSEVLFELETVVGALFKSANAFVIPCWGYLVLCRARLEGKAFKKAGLMALLVVGFVYGIVGTIAGLTSRESWGYGAPKSIVLWARDLELKNQVSSWLLLEGGL